MGSILLLSDKATSNLKLNSSQYGFWECTLVLKALVIKHNVCAYTVFTSHLTHIKNKYYCSGKLNEDIVSHFSRLQ